jgi:hypothetical protein
MQNEIKKIFKKNITEIKILDIKYDPPSHHIIKSNFLFSNDCPIYIQQYLPVHLLVHFPGGHYGLSPIPI